VKFTRSTLAILAAVAMVGLYGCGKSAEPTSVSPSLDGTPPSAPEGFSFAATTSYYRLAWSPSPDADVAKYQVYLYQPDPSRDNSYVMIGETTTSDFALPASISGIEAYFRVRAVDQTGNRSAYSDVYGATIPAAGNSGGAGTGDPGHRIQE